MSLTPEERRRIYEEEKTRIEAEERERHKRQEHQILVFGEQSPPADRSTYREVVDWWGRQGKWTKIIIVIIGLFLVGRLYDTLTPDRQAAQSPTAARPQSQTQRPASREPARTTAQEAYLNTLVQAGLSGARLSGNTLTVTVADSWYYSPEFEKRRLVQTIAAGLTAARQQDGAEGSGATYVFVDVKDRYGELVASYSAWTGIKIRR